MNAKKYFEKAKREGFGLGAFNAANLESIKAVVNAAVKTQSPLIIECSPGEVEHLGVLQAVSLVRSFEKQFQIPIILNLDHGTDPQKIIEAKLHEAKKHHPGDFFVEDTSLYLSALN